MNDGLIPIPLTGRVPIVMEMGDDPISVISGKWVRWVPKPIQEVLIDPNKQIVYNNANTEEKL